MATNPGRTNLEAWWAHDEAGTGSRADSHTGGETLTNNNAATAGGALVGAAATDFDTASNQYLSRAYADFPVFGGSYTVCGWFMLDSIDATRRIVTVYSATAGARAFLFQVGATNIPIFATYNSSGVGAGTATWGSSVATATWYFFAFWHDDAGDTVNLRLDNGSPVSTATTSEPNASPTADFVIGQYQGASSGGMDGVIDEVCVYSRVLTTDEIDWLYNSGAGRAYAETEEAAATISGAQMSLLGVGG